MQPVHPVVDGLAEIRELNRLFLTFLRGRLASHGENLGLPRGVAAAIARATDDLLRRLAAFPQAMFRLDLEALQRHEVMDTTAREVDPALGALQLMLLVSVRNLCRSNPYAARLYLRLAASDVARLSALTITELPVISGRHNLVRCGHARYGWMWSELLRTAQPERTQALVLLALQPPVEINPPLALST